MAQYQLDTTSLNHGYILTFNASTEKYEFVNPDDILSKSVTDTISPGLPINFLDLLDVNLDNKVNLDGGVW
jgi:hypothetical protein